MARKSISQVRGIQVGPYVWKHRKTYEAWLNAIRRCHDPEFRNYKNYGARGITVCPEWRGSFAAFRDYIGPPPEKWSSIDRWPDNDDGYRPGNVRWTTQAQNIRNRRNTLMIPWGENQTAIPAAEVAEILGVDPLPFLRYIWQRIYRQSYTPQEAIDEYLTDGRSGERRKKNSTLLRIKRGPLVSLQEAAEALGLKYDSVNMRRYRGATIAEALGLDDHDVEVVQETTRPRWDVDREKVKNHSTLIRFRDGRVLTVPESAQEAGIPYRTVNSRINKGWPVHEVFGLPIGSVEIIQRVSRPKRPKAEAPDLPLLV